MGKKLNTNIVNAFGGKIQWYPSSSIYQPTSSSPATSAQFDIHIPSTVGGDWVSNSELNPYIIIPLISSSHTSTDYDAELVIRFFTSSHFRDYRTGSFTPGGGGWNVEPISSSLYYTGSNSTIQYRDVLLTPTSSGEGTATLLRNTIFDLITGSAAYNSGMISASKQGNFTSSIFLTNARGRVNLPTVYTGSLASDTSFNINTISRGSGTYNFAEPYILSQDSASLSIEFDKDDPTSIIFKTPTSSRGSTRPTEATLYFSGSGQIGFNTKNPKDEIDFKADSFKVRSNDGTREFRFENSGKLTTKKFSAQFGEDSPVSESIGSEIILSYTPGTFESPQKAQVGETIGTINYVDESFNILGTEDAFFRSGSVAQITSTVRRITSLGAAGDLQFKVNVDPASPQETLISFINIDPHTNGATVLFPYGITATTNIVANGNIVGDGATDLTNMSDGTFSGTLQSANIAAFNLTGKLTAGSTEIEGSAFDINGGTIDGATIATSNITVGAGKTLELREAAAVNFANNAISGDTIEGGTIGSTTITTLANTNLTTTSITSSGNISASGNVYSANEEAINFTFQLDMPSANWFGPNRQGPNYYFWNKDYGNDTAVQTLDWSSAASNERFLNSGWRIPYKMEITRIHFYGHNAQNASSGEALTATASLLVGSPETGAPGASSIPLQTLGTILTNVGASRYAAITGSVAVNSIVSESQYVYPRVKATNNNQDINGNYTIYYKRIQ